MNLDAIGLICSNLENSIKFYSSLGLKFKEVGGAEHLEATTKSGCRLMLDSEELIKKINPNWSATKNGRMVLCFKVETPAQVDKFFKIATHEGKNSVKEPWDAFWGQRYASVLDPDGNQVDIFTDL